MDDKCKKCGCDWKAVGTMFKMLETFYEGWKSHNAAQQNIYALASSDGVWLFTAEGDEEAESGVKFGRPYAGSGYVGWLLWTEATLSILEIVQPKIYASPKRKTVDPQKEPWIKTSVKAVVESIRESGILKGECCK